MKALSIAQPWIHAIFVMGKDVENRVWRTHFRGRFLIHAGKSKQWYKDAETWWEEKFGTPLPAWDDLPTGAIVGAVTLVDCVHPDDTAAGTRSSWAADDSWHWHLAEPMLLAEPIPYRGLQLLFNVPYETLTAAERTRLKFND